MSAWSFPLVYILIIAAIPTLGGLVFFFVGLKGRRLGTHPVCRRCQFDLRGRPQDSKICPECGADLTLPRAIVTGHRVRRRGLLWTGVVVSILSFMSIGLLAAHFAREINWIEWYPTSWILNDAQTATGPTQLQALRELTRRITEQDLSTGKARSVLAIALTKMSDPRANDWFDIIAAAGRAGLVTDDQSKSLLEQLVTTSINARPIVRRERSLVTDFDINWNAHSSLVQKRDQTTITYGSAVLEQPRPEEFGNVSGGSSSSRGGSFRLNRKTLGNLANGAHDLIARTEVEASIVGPWKAGPFKFIKESKMPVKLVDKDDIVDEFVKGDPELKKAVEAAISEVVLDVVDGKVIAQLRTRDLPIGLSIEGFIHRPGAATQPMKIGSIRCEAGSEDYWHNVGWGYPAHYTDGAVDLLLRPSQTTAEWSMKLSRYWGEDITIPNIPVRTKKPWFSIDESLRPAIEKSLSIQLKQPQPNGDLSVVVSVKNPPTLLNYDIYLRSASGKQTRAGDVRLTRGSNNSSYWQSGKLPEKDLKHVDVVLIPRIDTYDRPASAGLPWGGEIVYKNLPVPEK